MSEDHRRGRRTDYPRADGLEGSDADEQELLAAFDRLSPQDDLRWCFDNAMRRIERPDSSAAGTAAPWRGLPDDLWERGRSARIGQRFVGDVAGVLADILAADARSAADAAASSVNLATWDALRYLAARVELLEGRIDPLGLEAAEWSLELPDPGDWLEAVDDLVGSPGPGGCRPGGRVRGGGPGGLPGPGRAAGGGCRTPGRVGVAVDGVLGRPAVEPGPDIVFAEVLPHLMTVPADSVAGVVLLGCSDRLDLVGKGRAARAVRAHRPAGRDRRGAGHRPGGVGRSPPDSCPRSPARPAPPPGDVVPAARPSRCRRPGVAPTGIGDGARGGGPGGAVT